MSILQEFVQNGCVAIDLSEELGDFHDKFIEKTKSTPLIEGNTMDDSYPELSEIFSHSQVVSALKLFLGENYIQGHMRSRFSGQYLPNRFPHRDFGSYYSSYVGYNVSPISFINPWSRDHYCRMIQLFYLPASNYITRSGTGFIPGSQYWDDLQITNMMNLDFDCDRIRLRKKGMVILAHSDLWHYAYPQSEWDDRLLIKTSFFRTESPVASDIPNLDFIWKDNVTPSRVSNYHWNWYFGNKVSLDNSLNYSDFDRDSFSGKSCKERLEGIYQLAGIQDTTPMIEDIFSSELVSDNYYSGVLATALSLNLNCKSEMVEVLDQDRFWRDRAIAASILSNMGKDDSLSQKWNSWLESGSGYFLVNLVRGAPIVCQGNPDTLNLIVDSLKSPGNLRGDLVLNESINSVMQLAKSTGIIPDIESNLDSYISEKGEYISSNAYQAKKFLYN